MTKQMLEIDRVRHRELNAANYTQPSPLHAPRTTSFQYAQNYRFLYSFEALEY